MSAAHDVSLSPYAPVGRVLVVAATTRELAPSHGWHVVRCGVGPVDAAVATSAALATAPRAWRAVLHIGIAGARERAKLPLGTVVLGDASHYDDLGVPEQFAPRVAHPDAGLLAAARQALPEATVQPIATTARVGGSHSALIEAMEGFAVLRAAERAGVPALEVRVISNLIEEQDRSRWAFDDAFARVLAITPTLVAALAHAMASTD